MSRWLVGFMMFCVTLAVLALVGVVRARLMELLFFDALTLASACLLSHVARIA